MTPRQKDIISALALANVIVIVAWIVLVTRPSYPDPMSRIRIRVSPVPTPTLAYWKCQWQATQLLAQAGLGGTVTPVPDGLLHFEISSPIAPLDSDPADRNPADQNLEAVDEAAQAVWTVFDVALALQERMDRNPADENPEDVCPPFTRIQVTILAARPGAQATADAAGPLIRRDQLIPSVMRISASVSAADLAAFGAGELSEDEFIDRVTYTISENDD
jgi:hypothetical protein